MMNVRDVGERILRLCKGTGMAHSNIENYACVRIQVVFCVVMQ